MKSLKESILGKQDFDKVTNNVQEMKRFIDILRSYLRDISFSGEPDDYRRETLSISKVNDPVLLRFFANEIRNIQGLNASKSVIQSSVKDEINRLRSRMPYETTLTNKVRNIQPLVIKKYTMTIKCCDGIVIEFISYIDRNPDGDYVLSEFDVIINEGFFKEIYPDKKL